MGDFLQGHLFVSLAGASRMMDLNAEYLAAGANRHPAAADWDENGILAFGADRNIALWRPQVRLPALIIRVSVIWSAA